MVINMMGNFYVWLDRDIDKLEKVLVDWHKTGNAKELARGAEETVIALMCHIREIERLEEKAEYKEKLPYESFDGSKWELNKDR